MSRAPVFVKRGQTTEITLISQCQSEGRGAVDVVATLNHAPKLLDLVFTTSKFVAQCRDEEVCATVADQDHDPLILEWRQIAGDSLLRGPTVSRSIDNADGSLTECVIVAPRYVARHEITVSVYDQLRDTDGNLIRFDDYFAAAGAPYTSHDELIFPLFGVEDGLPGNCVTTSCRELHELDPSAPSGIYSIDPDGEGGVASFEAWCEMTLSGGGWTLVAARNLNRQTLHAISVLLPNDDALAISNERWAAIRSVSTESLANLGDTQLIAQLATLAAARCVPLSTDLTAQIIAHNETSGCDCTGFDYSNWFGCTAPERETYFTDRSDISFYTGGGAEYYLPAKALMYVR